MSRKQATVLSSDVQLMHGAQLTCGMAIVLPTQSRRQQRPHVLTGNLRDHIAGHLFGGFVELLYDAVLIRDDDGVHRGFEYCAIPTLALAQLFFYRRPSEAFSVNACDEQRGENEY